MIAGVDRPSGTRIKLCAIARNEGPYLVDWVRHHLRYGFDGVEVMVNGTTDDSVEILNALHAQFPHVEHREDDALLAQCLAEGRNFQHRAYRLLALRAQRQGYTHAAFLDLDEYWTPRDVHRSIHDFVPEDDDVNVVSFPWLVDVPDPAQPPFVGPGERDVRAQLNPHVKSVVQLDERVRRYRTHTARTRSGSRLLIKRPFPIQDEQRQQWGSLITNDELRRTWHEVPEAFVLHSMHRSPVEYLASLAQGLRQTGRGEDLKVNRLGYLRDRDAPELTLARRVAAPPVGIAEAATQRSITAARGRAELLVQTLSESEPMMRRLRVALRGLRIPALDSRYPGWDHALRWHVDLPPATSHPLITGWAFVGSEQAQGAVEFEIRCADGSPIAVVPTTWTDRPDVVAVHPQAPLCCGFRLDLPSAWDPTCTLWLRSPDGYFWESCWPPPVP